MAPTATSTATSREADWLRKLQGASHAIDDSRDELSDIASLLIAVGLDKLANRIVAEIDALTAAAADIRQGTDMVLNESLRDAQQATASLFRAVIAGAIQTPPASDPPDPRAFLYFNDEKRAPNGADEHEAAARWLRSRRCDQRHDDAPHWACTREPKHLSDHIAAFAAPGEGVTIRARWPQR